jgi:hypothetical protein
LAGYAVRFVEKNPRDRRNEDDEPVQENKIESDKEITNRKF